MSINLNFRYGSVNSLSNVAPSPGCVYVTTDEKSMYVDLPISKEVIIDGQPNIINETQRIRLGDFLEYENLEAVNADKKNWSTQTLVYIREGNILAKCNWVDKLDSNNAPIINPETGERE